MIETVGQITDAQEAAEACVAQMQARSTSSDGGCCRQGSADGILCNRFWRIRRLYGRWDTFIHQLITLAGGDNIAKDVSGWVITNEAIFEADPQSSGPHRMKELFMADPLYAG
jgi:iron complex transport system substrate-binding protein